MMSWIRKTLFDSTFIRESNDHDERECRPRLCVTRNVAGRTYNRNRIRSPDEEETFDRRLDLDYRPSSNPIPVPNGLNERVTGEFVMPSYTSNAMETYCSGRRARFARSTDRILIHVGSDCLDCKTSCCFV